MIDLRPLMAGLDPRRFDFTELAWRFAESALDDHGLPPPLLVTLTTSNGGFSELTFTLDAQTLTVHQGRVAQPRPARTCYPARIHLLAADGRELTLNLRERGGRVQLRA